MSDNLHAHRRHGRLCRLHPLVIPAAIIFFASGYWASSARCVTVPHAC